MPTTINGDTGINKVQPESITQEALAPNVAGNGPAFRITGGATPLGSGLNNRLHLSVVDHDTHIGFDSVNRVYVVKVAGYYSLSASMGISPAGGNPYRTVWIGKNGSAVAVRIFANHTSVVIREAISVASVYCAVGDYIDVSGSQNSGGTINSIACDLSGALVRAA